MLEKSFYKSWDKKNNNYKKEDLEKNNIYKSILKYFLPILIIGILILLIKWIKIIPEYDIINFEENIEKNEPDSVIKPKLILKNKNNKPLLIQANQTKKDVNDPNIIFLTKPTGYYKLSDKTTIYFNAIDGILYLNKNELKLNKSVEITSSEGTNLNTHNIVYNIKNNIISGKENIALLGDWGKLYGKGFIYDIENSLITFKGRPNIKFHNTKGAI